MKKKKWKPFLIASTAVLLIASIGIGIYAFLSDGDTANNRTTIGGVTTDIPEKFTPRGNNSSSARSIKKEE